MNGPSVGQAPNFNLPNQPYRPSMLPNQGQFQPTQPPSFVGLNRPPVLPSFVPPGQSGATGPPTSQFSHPVQPASDSTSEGKIIFQILFFVKLITLDKMVSRCEVFLFLHKKKMCH